MPSILPVGPRIYVNWTGLTDSLVSYWKLDEASGTRNDSHGTNHLTDNNTVTQAVGKIENAAQFTAANTEYLSVASNATLQTGDIDYTIACWVYLDSKTTYRLLVMKDGFPTAGQREYGLTYDFGADRFVFAVFTATDVARQAVANSLGSPATGTWYLVIGWHDSVANTVNIQVNNGTVDSTSTGGALQAASTAPVTFGAASGFAFYHDGRLDEALFTKQVLSSEQRAALYHSTSGLAYPFGLEVTSRAKAPPGVTTERGKDQLRILSPPMAGHFTCTVDNQTKDYSSENEASPLYGFVEPGKTVTVISDPGSGDYPIWKGVLDDIAENPAFPEKDVDFVAIGRLSMLVGQKVSTDLYENITIDEALEHLLDAAEWPAAERTIAVSSVNLIRWALADEDAFAAMLKLLNTEGPSAAIYEGANGYFVFEDRHYRETQTRSLVSNFTFDAPLELDYNPAFKDVVNECVVEVVEREVGEEEIIWELGQAFTLAANESRDFIASVTGGEPFVDAVVPTTLGINEVQSLFVTSDIGDYTDTGGLILSFRGQVTPLTQPEQTDIQNALDALSTIGSGNVSVGSAPLPFQITFQGTLGNQPVELLGVTASGGFGAAIIEVSLGQLADYLVTAGSIASITLNRTAGFSCTITVTAGVSGASVSGLRLRAKRITVLTTHSIKNDYDASASIRKFGLKSISPSIVGDISLDEGLILTNRYVEQNRNRRATGHIQIFNDTNQGLVREISDLITIEDTQTDLDNVFWIEQIRNTFVEGRLQLTTFGVERAHADSHTDSHTDTAHSDSAHTDTHSDTAHTDTAHVDSHTDSASHSDVAHTDTHSDVAHSDSAHSDVSHSDSHSDDHTDTAHSDTVHGDTHSDAAHSDTAHGDTAHSDDAESGHGDSHSDFTDQFFEHGDDHSDDHTDTHSDTAHSDTAHSDAGHTDSHSDDAHTDTAHVDSHSDVAHGDDAHTDTAHSDAAHTDTHSDVAHSDDAHSDTHSDTAHSDAAHADTHSDAAHSDTAHVDSHTDTHSDAS